MSSTITRAILTLGTIGLCAAIGFTAIAPASAPADPSAQATYRDMDTTLGILPSFFKVFPETSIVGAWGEFKSVQLNPNSALSGKTKELIGLAVASQIPCTYCVYFHTVAAKANGATDEETREAVAMAAISRHWGTVLNGMQADLTAFRNLVAFKKATDPIQDTTTE